MPLTEGELEKERNQKILAKWRMKTQQYQKIIAERYSTETPVYKPVDPAAYTSPSKTDSRKKNGKYKEIQKYEFYTKKELAAFNTYVVLDCETTGFSQYMNEIIEIAMIKYVKGELVDQFSTLVAPSEEIPPHITELTGITNVDLKNAPSFDEVMPKILAFIRGFTIVGHNITFDLRFLSEQFEKNGYRAHFDYVDTQVLARSAFPNFPNHSLNTCIGRLLLRDNQTHRALDDIICTQRLLEKCKAVLLEQEYIN